MTTLDAARHAASTIRPRLSHPPTAGLVLGSSQGGFAARVAEAVTIPYAEIPHMPRSTVAGHAGELRVGLVGGVPTAVFCGRFHLYEGYDPRAVVFPVLLLHALGVRRLVLTNAAGGVNAAWAVGDLMLVSDHIDHTGRNPLVGENIAPQAPRFPDLTAAYDPAWRAAARTAAAERGVVLREGVYMANLGPTYETPAEIRMARVLGADAVGMSTVPETIVARALGMRVVAVSTITNLAAGLSPAPLSHDEVRAAGELAQAALFPLLERIVAAAPEE